MNDHYQVLQDFVKIFDAQGLPYAVMGGIAVRAHGIPRPTYDIDFTLVIDRQRLTDLYRTVRKPAIRSLPLSTQAGPIRWAICL